MIDLYALTSPNVVKIFIALEELALPYNIIPVDVWKSEQHKPEFAKLNPNKKIPVIVDHEGPGGKPYTVFESGAILLYLADKGGKLVPKDKRAYFDMMQWLMVQVASVGPMFGQNVHFRRFAPPGDHKYSASRYFTEANRLYDLYEQRLGDHEYVAGHEYTLADIAAFPWLRNHELLGIAMEKRPKVAAWVAKIAARPAVKQAMAKVGTITSVRDTAADEDKDRFFGRGKYAHA
jgi:GST-like protein